MLMCKKPTDYAPCRRACPAGIDVSRYVRAIGQGKFAEALAIIREKIPFPSICGLICVHPCETRCQRGQLDKAISIRLLKRAAVEYGSKARKSNSRVTLPTGRRVAIIGSGPAGLTAAYYLAKHGHLVTVFEELPQPGGMMRIGIPDYRLPKDVLNAEIEEVQAVGVDIQTNTRVDQPEELLREGYEAVFFAIGAHQGIKMGIEGEDNPRLIEGVTFLKNVNLGKKVRLGDRVGVIGGGNVAVDSARTALRLGAKEVTIVYRRSRNELLASPEEIEEALAEGIRIRFLTQPSQLIDRDSEVEMVCTRMRLGKVDTSGRRRPVPIQGSEFNMNFHNIITAIGQRPSFPKWSGLPIASGNTIEVHPDTLATANSGIFAGGDVVSGPASVIEAIAMGRKAAISIDKYLGGGGDIEDALASAEVEVPLRVGGTLNRNRAVASTLPVEQRVASFAMVEVGLTEEQAAKEANRCLWCDLPIFVEPTKCVGCYRCGLACSLRFEGMANPTNAKLKVVTAIQSLDESVLSFTNECDACGICVSSCSYDVLSRGGKSISINGDVK